MSPSELEFTIEKITVNAPVHRQINASWSVDKDEVISMTIKPVPRWKQKLNAFLIFWGFKKKTPELKSYPEIKDFLPVVPEATKDKMPETFEDALIKELTSRPSV